MLEQLVGAGREVGSVLTIWWAACLAVVVAATIVAVVYMVRAKVKVQVQ